MRQRVSLDGAWALTFLPEADEPSGDPAALASFPARTIPAMVPGTIELALQEAGLIADPFFGRNSFALRVYETYAWWFQRSFTVPASFEGDRYFLVFHGLDTLATIWLNGQEIGQTANMLIPHTFDITALLRREGENRLVVRLGSALHEAARRPYPPLLSGPDERPEGLWLRKAPHMYGWDILPRLVSAGLWRSVTLETRPAIRLESLYFWTALSDAGPRVGVQVRVAADAAGVDDLSVRLTGECGEHTFQHSLPLEFVSATTSFAVPRGQLWWPRGYGEPNLYTVRAELVRGDTRPG